MPMLLSFTAALEELLLFVCVRFGLAATLTLHVLDSPSFFFALQLPWQRTRRLHHVSVPVTTIL